LALQTLILITNSSRDKQILHASSLANFAPQSTLNYIVHSLKIKNTTNVSNVLVAWSHAWGKSQALQPYDSITWLVEVLTQSPDLLKFLHIMQYSS